MKIFRALCVPVLALSGALIASPASAHTPAISASCDGVRVAATSYDDGLANRWSVTIGGVTQTGTFGESVDQTFPVPQDGATTTWSASVEAADGSYRGESSGAVGPCGTPPPVDVCPDLPGDQPEGTECAAPPVTERADAQQLDGCTVSFRGKEYGAGELSYDEQYSDAYTFNATTGVWDLVTDTEPTVTNVVFTPWTTQQQVAKGCTDKPVQPPAAQSSLQESDLVCADDTLVITTTATTTPYVYDAPTNDWVLGAPVAQQPTVREEPVDPGQCGRTGVKPVGTATLVPTAVAAGAAAPVAAPVAAPAVAQVSAPVTPERQPLVPVLLLLAGAAALSAGAFRLHRR